MSNWREVRAKRPPREDHVALHRAHLDEVEEGKLRMSFISHEEAVQRSIEFMESERAEKTTYLILLVHGRTLAAELREMRTKSDTELESDEDG